MRIADYRCGASDNPPVLNPMDYLIQARFVSNHDAVPLHYSSAQQHPQEYSNHKDRRRSYPFSPHARLPSTQTLRHLAGRGPNLLPPLGLIFLASLR